LGNNVLVLKDGDGSLVQKSHYYPFGMSFNEGVGLNIQPYKYNGKELDQMHGLNLYDYSARHYDSAIGRFTTVDPLSEKYYSVSPYAYCNNNPIKYVDYRGDSISVAAIQAYDQANGTNYLQTIMSDLSSQTGLTYSVTASGMLVYNMDSDGKAIISTTTDTNGNIVQVGSQEGRDIMTQAIGHTTTAYALITDSKESNSIVGGNRILLSHSQINGFINNTHGVDNRTLGWGMTFMHETLHSAVGGGLRDPASRLFGPTGAVVDKMNLVRAELNAQGGNYGRRMSYTSYTGVTGSTTSYLPFNQSTYNLMEYGINPAPTPSMQFIISRRP
jgi:RHS repeat-associated protein